MIATLIKRSLPAPVLRLIRSYKNREYNNLTTEQVFSRIYEKSVWGRSEDPASLFYSGSGSRRDNEISPYVQSVANFLRSLEVKPDVVDLGCGDFTVGSQVRAFCNRYIACDIVPSLIASNKSRFEDLGVEFKVLDLILHELPPGDIAFVRQVFQHLSNDQIGKFVERASLSYNTRFELVGPYTIAVVFEDRTEQVIDFEPILHGELFGPLRDQATFSAVTLDSEAGTLVWPNGADFNPATLHDWPRVRDEFRKAGRFLGRSQSPAG